ncbi:histidine kinase [candidate division KSB1 bacterium]|nr:histidine kinase [candidate division KSB1 bacterium]
MKNNKKLKITRQGFILGILFWLLWSLLFGGILKISEDLAYGLAFFSSLLAYAPLALLSMWIYYFCGIYSSEKRSRFVFFAVHILMSFFVSAVWIIFDYGFHYLLWGDAVFVYKPFKQVGIFSFIQGVMMYGVLAGIFYSLFYQKKMREKELLTALLQAETRQAELRALKSQVNPHFLFNTLNTIFALMDSDIQKAKSTVTELSDLLRYSMAGFYQEMVPLRDEVNMVKRYLNIEKQRFSERLAVLYDIDESLMEQKVPPMLLQPFIENAVKHGITRSKAGGKLVLSICREDQGLKITIKNTGASPVQKRIQLEKNGIGLTNVRKRLELVYDDQFSMHTAPGPGADFVVTIRLPFSIEKK